MDEQVYLGKTQTQTGNIQRVEAGTGNLEVTHLEGTQKHCLSVQI